MPAKSPEPFQQLVNYTKAKMICPVKQLALALICVGAANVASAAQPGATLATTRLASNTSVSVKPAAPGTLSAFKAATNAIEAGQPLTFQFQGAGHCQGKLNSGDGVVDFEGNLPFNVVYTYGTGSMSSFAAFKNYTATATPVGNCKTTGPASLTVAVLVSNPNPQSAGVPPKDTTVTLAGTGKIKVAAAPGKPDTVPTVAATIASIVVSDKAFTGAPNTVPGSAAPLAMAAGSPTMLTVQGTGICKYRLSYVNLDAQGNLIVKQYPMVSKSSSAQSPFPMSLLMLNATPAGIYKWTAVGIDGCTGNKDVTFTVQ